MARLLVTEKLVACCNISDGMTSVYEWDGKICEDQEVALFLKTKQELAEKTTARIADLHPYDTPCIIQWDISGGHKDYLKWLECNLA